MTNRKLAAMHARFGIDESHKCKDCNHLISYTANRRWYKCECYGNSSSEATDWRLKWIACGLFNQEYDGYPVKEILKHSPKYNNPESQVEGQMSIGDLYG